MEKLFINDLQLYGVKIGDDFYSGIQVVVDKGDGELYNKYRILIPSRSIILPMLLTELQAINYIKDNYRQLKKIYRLDE